MPENVGKRDRRNDEWNTVHVDLLQPHSSKNWLHLCLLSAICCVTGWKYLIGIIVYRTKTLRTPINILIVNVAMSDLFQPIFHVPRLLVGLNTAGYWLISGPLGQPLCKLSAFVTDVSVHVSIQSLVLIAVDRFVAVVFPLRSPLISSKQCRFFIIVIWIVAMAFHYPYLFALKVVEYSEGLYCQWQWNDAFGESSSQKGYRIASIILIALLPLVLNAILYFTIALRIKFQKIPGEHSANIRAQRLTRERNVLKMSIAIVLVFAVCWLPFSILTLLRYISSDEKRMITSCSFQQLRRIAYLLACSHWAVNPLICFIFSGSYRQGLKNLLRCCFTDQAAQ